jgi:hypothetical protein
MKKKKQKREPDVDWLDGRKHVVCLRLLGHVSCSS